MSRYSNVLCGCFSPAVMFSLQCLNSPNKKMSTYILGSPNLLHANSYYGHCVEDLLFVLFSRKAYVCGPELTDSR